MTITTEMLTRNIAKSGEVLNLGGVSPFGHHLGLIVNRSQSASCHIAQPLPTSLKKNDTADNLLLKDRKRKTK